MNDSAINGPTEVVPATCPECGPDLAVADVFETGRPVAGVCLGCGMRVHFGPHREPD